MKKLFLRFILLLLFFVLNIEATNIIVKVDKQFSTNSSIKKIIADKEKIDKKKAVFDKNLNVALLTDEELKQLINDALLNCNNAELMELGTKLGIAQKYDWTPIISSAILARTKCDLKKSQQKCNYALDCWRKEYLKGDVSDKTKELLYEAVDGVPIGCQDWMTVGYMAVTVPRAMNVTIENDKDFDKAWELHKKAVLAVKACKWFPGTQRKGALSYEETIQSILLIRRHKDLKISKQTAQEVIEYVKKTPEDAWTHTALTREETITKFKGIINKK